MRQMKRMSLIALLMAFALVAAACGGDDGGTADPGVDTGDDGEVTGGEFSVAICEPQFLMPGNTQETCGAQVLQGLFTPLVEFDPDTAEPSNLLAESIESEDLQTWTVTIQEGWTFHNGEDLTAQSYVDAWNWAANAENKALNSYFFGNIEGYSDLNPEKGKPKTDEMSGLRVVDDTTFEVTLSEPFSQFPLTVGYTAFYPLPQAFFDDPDAYNEAPIGNGPFEMDGKWRHDREIRVSKWADYPGEEANADSIEFRIYADLNTSYTDLLAGNIDIIDSVPTEQLAQAPQDLGDRFVQKESSYFGYLGFPMYEEPWDNVELRRAVSLAVDREAITTAIYQGAYTPAESIIPPVVPGFREEAICEYCHHDPEQAAQLWEDNNGPDQVTLWFNNDGGHEEWMEAVSNQLRRALGVRTSFESMAFEEYLTLQDQHQLTGPYRGAWVFDYPSPQNYLEPIFGCDGSSQEFGYEDHGCEEAQEAIDAGNAEPDLDAAIEHYHQAEEAILEDLPAAPLWFGVTQAGYGPGVENVIFDVFSFVRLEDVEVVDA